MLFTCGFGDNDLRRSGNCPWSLEASKDRRIEGDKWKKSSKSKGIVASQARQEQDGGGRFAVFKHNQTLSAMTHPTLHPTTSMVGQLSTEQQGMGWEGIA